MKLNISNPSTGLQKVIEIDDDKKLLPFYDKRMSHEISGDTLGDEFKGYVFRISGGNDKQGFPMKQGVLVNHRVRLLFKKGMSCFRERRNGSRKRKSVRGCIVGPDLAMLNLVVVKKGEGDVPGLTDDQKPRRLGPKRASNIRKLFALQKQDDVRQFVVRREAGKKKKAPKIQRLITPVTLQRRRRLRSLMRNKLEMGKKDRKAYFERVAEYRQEQKAKRAAEVAKKKKEKKKGPVEEEKPAPPAKKAKEEPKKAAAKASAGKAAAKATGKAAAKQQAAPKAAAGKAAAKQGGKKK